MQKSQYHLLTTRQKMQRAKEADAEFELPCTAHIEILSFQFLDIGMLRVNPLFGRLVPQNAFAKIYLNGTSKQFKEILFCVYLQQAAEVRHKA